MAKQTAVKEGCYLYAIVADAEERTYGPLGVDDTPVYSVSNGALAAVTSNVPNRRLRPERRHLAAHQRVLKRLMEDGTPLPISFGVIADGPKDIRHILCRNRDELAAELKLVRGRVEMGLRVSWDAPNIFAYFVSTHPGLATLRDRLFRGGHEPSHEEKIELGRLFDRLLSEDRASYVRRVTDVLAPHCVEMREAAPRNENEVMSLACLIDKDGRDTFESAVFEAARSFDNNYCFDFNGPWAPYNFVQVHLRMA